MPDNNNRLLDAIRSIIRSEFPDYTYRGVFEYAVQEASEMRVAAAPVDTTLGLPYISDMPIKSSILGETVTPTVGNVILVAFVNGSPSRPVVVGCEATNQKVSVKASQSISLVSGLELEAKAVTTTVDGQAVFVGPKALTVQVAGPGLPAARVTDQVLVLGIFSGQIVSGSLKTTIG